MSTTGYYYLHENGDLIYKCDFPGIVADFRDSDLVRMFWPINPGYRETAWTLLVESLAAGALPRRVCDLADKWQCTDEDAAIYARRVGCNIFRDGDAWRATRADFVNLQESAAGFGSSPLEAMAALAKELGYRPAKMWGATFKDLLAERAKEEA